MATTAKPLQQNLIPQFTADPQERLTIGLIGFGLFGQFLAKRMVMRGHRVIAWNKTPYPEAAKELGVDFYADMDDLCEEHPEVRTLCVV